MKQGTSFVIALTMFALLLSSITNFGSSQSTINGTQNTVAVKFYCALGGQAFLTGTLTHTSSEAARLEIPFNASEGSCALCLYEYNRTFSSLQSFQVYASYLNAVPRFVIALDTNGDGLMDTMLLSDYQAPSNGTWQLTQGGQQWGWTKASIDLAAYGITWNSSDYWKSIYGNATALYVGVALEYWAVKDSNGLGQALFSDEVIINGKTYNIALPHAESPNGTVTGDWPMFHHDLEHSGNTLAAPCNGTFLWRFPTGDLVRSSAAVVNGVVYIGSNGGSIYALNATTGAEIWAFEAAAGIESSPAVMGNVVYIGVLWDDHNGYVIALNATNGSLIWRFACSSGIESSPAFTNGIVYIGSYNGYLYALNASNGSLIWSFRSGGSMFSSPAVEGGNVYVGSEDGHVYALEASDGSLIWAFSTGSVDSSPTIAGGILYFSTHDGYVIALNASIGTLIWQFFIGGHIDTTPAAAGSVIYVNAGKGYLYAFNAYNGSLIWFASVGFGPHNANAYVYSSPAVSGNTVYVGSYDGYVLALDASTGSLLWFYQTNGFIFASPVFVDGIVFVGSFDGNIYALGKYSGSITTSSLTSQPNPTTQPTATQTPSPPSNLSTSPSQAPAVAAQDDDSINMAVPNPIPSRLPVPLSTFQPEPTVLDQMPAINWIMLSAILAILAAFLAVVVFAFKKKPS